MKCLIPQKLLLIFILLISAGNQSLLAGISPTASSGKHDAVADNRGALPPGCFVENRGQITDPSGLTRTDLQFKLAAAGMQVFIGNGQLHYQWTKNGDSYAPAAPGGSALRNDDGTDNGETTEIYRMDMTLVGADPHARVITEQRQPYREQHYLPGQQAIMVHTFRKVIYKDVYPHIDWVLYTDPAGIGQASSPVKYDFVVHPGGRVSDIRMKYSGHTDLQLNGEGAFTAVTPSGTIQESAPYSYTTSTGSKYATSTGSEVPSRFVLDGDEIGFDIGAFEGTLVIDPAISWITYYGGTELDAGRSVRCDSSGNVYLGGYTSSTTNIATQGSFQQYFSPGGSNAFLVKFDSTGNRLWATYYGGGATDHAWSIACDPLGNIYLAGATGSTGMATGSSHQPVYGGSTDALLVKFDPAGILQWATYYGGTGEDRAWSAACDGAGNVYLAGTTQSTAGIAAAGHQMVYGGAQDGFLVKFDSDGRRLWGTYYGGAGEEQAYSVACEGVALVYLTGYTRSNAGMTAGNGFQLGFGGGYCDGYLACFQSGGTRNWATYYGASGTDYGYALAVDADSNIYLTGYTTSTDSIATPGSHQHTLNGNYDAFLVKFIRTGDRQWATYYGGSSTDQAYAIACDRAGNVYIAGQTNSPDHIAGINSLQSQHAGSYDAFLAKFDPTGTRNWGTYYGTDKPDYAYGLACMGKGQVYMAGQTASLAGFATPGSHQTVHGGVEDGFLFKIDDCTLPGSLSPVSGADTVCKGSLQTYSVPKAANAAFYTWTLPPGWTGRSRTNSIDVVVTGSGTVTVQAEGNCEPGMIQAFPVHAVSADAEITINGAVLGTTNAFITYQWYLDGNLISGATGPTYTVLANGLYRVVVSNGYGCTDSAFYRVTNVGIPQAGRAGVQIAVYPNPANNRVYIDAPFPVNISIWSSEGKYVLHREQVNTISVTDLAAGIYLMRVCDQAGTVLKMERLTIFYHGMQ